MTTIGDKRVSQETDLASVQRGNEKWWSGNPMAYDWNDRVKLERFSKEWFDEIDRRFIHGARLFAHGKEPFDRIMPFDQLRGKRVLEIGCGMGLHSELLVRHGADLTSVDLSETSVMATRKRLALRGLQARVEKMDAVNLEFADAEFDFVWSWGVIHHSAQTARIVQQISRVLRPGGEARVMVYNLHSATAYVTMVTRYLLGFWRGRTLDDCLWATTDGYMARYYAPDQLTDLFSVFFKDVSVSSYGQESDGVPLPRHLRGVVMRLMSEQKLAELSNKRGFFLFVKAQK